MEFLVSGIKVFPTAPSVVRNLFLLIATAWLLAMDPLDVLILILAALVVGAVGVLWLGSLLWYWQTVAGWHW